MIVSEGIKADVVPVEATPSEASAAGNMGVAVGCSTPLRARNQQSTASNTTDKEKFDNVTSIKGKMPPKPPDEFYKDLQQFHERRGTPIMHMPKISGRVVDLHRLYLEVTDRGGFAKVNMRDEWEEILPELGMREKCVNGTAAIKYIYRRCLEKYERLNFFGEDPDKLEALEAVDVSELGSGRGLRVRYPSSIHGSANLASINAVPMTYNYRQHNVNMDRRRQFKLSTDLHKASPYEKLMLSLISPLPNEQDFAINACTLMANESKHTLKINEYPKLLDVLLAHAGVFSDYSIRKLFQHIYTDIRRHSLYGFWRDLLHDRPQILELYTDEQALRDAALIDDNDDEKDDTLLADCLKLDFLNLGRGLGTQDYVGQRVQQIVSVLRNLSFFDENLHVLAKSRTFLRFLVMSSNIRWGNVHIQALEIAGNVASELELLDPISDDLSRSLMATLCDGIESSDRAVIINCLEILYKLCQKDSNEDHVLKCLNLAFYQTITLFLSLNDIMLLIFTLEAIYALTSMGARSCHLMMQVRGIVDQLVSLITVEAQSYGPDGCILMRVVETVPGNMLPMVAQNIANLQNVAVIQKQQPPLPQQQQQQQQQQQSPLPIVKPQVVQQPAVPVPHEQPQPSDQVTSGSEQQSAVQQQPQQQPPLQMPQNYTHEDEQYALAWLGATFERAASVESHVEQQELYRMYLSHCQKSGKHSVVNHLQFPRLVRLIFNNNVGPVIVRRSDGTELPGFHYVAIRVRAQPLPIQSKINAATSQTAQKPGETTALRKIKKKIKPQQEGAQAQEGSNEVTRKDSSVGLSSPTTCPTTQAPLQPHPQTGGASGSSEHNDNPKMEVEGSVESQTVADSKSVPTETTTSPTTEASVFIQTTTSMQQHSQQQQTPTSSLIKSLLANKVTQRQQKQKDLTANTTTTSTTTNVLPVVGTMSTTPTSQQNPQPIKVASTAISALVNNPLMQNTPVKVGQTTIKPLNPQLTLEKKQLVESAPPPLAPLSGSNVTKDSSGRQVLLANQMLVEILDKKMVDPPLPGANAKRKLDESTSNLGTDSAKRLAMESSGSGQIVKEETHVTPSKNAANLYAEMAASILEDEDLDDIPPIASQNSMESHNQSLVGMGGKVHQTSAPATVQRQLVFQTNQGPQLKLAPTSGTQQIASAMATIKTDQGLQTVPVILQQKPHLESAPSTQIIQQVIQGSAAAQSQPQTQYVLATNPQGQTYLVAQQSAAQPPQPPPQPTQTVLVTQTPQQQSAGTKTIIILQQQTISGPSTQQQILANAGGGTQKVIMTTPQGQQVLVTQRAQTPQQIFINPQTGAATHIQHVPVSNVGPTMQTQSANLLQRQLIQTSGQTTQQSLHTATGQISPSLLNQLNQIPATIKLHQPAPPAPQHPPQPATISRLGKTVSIVQTAPATPAPVPIPQLQQHQSIIQQHIISGPAEKRHVILGGGRTIEIKETVITQAQPPPQQCQLNSQTIITTQPPPPPPPPSPAQTPTPPLQQHQQMQVQQQQQQIRAVIEQQQHHPSIIQQKISVPLPQPPTNQTLVQNKISETLPAMMQPKTTPHTQSVAQTVVPPTVCTQATIANVKKAQTVATSTQLKPQLQQPSLPVVKLPPVSTTGPPPLTVTSPAATATATTTQNQLSQQQQHKESAIDVNKKDEASLTNHIPHVGPAASADTPPQTSSTIQTTAASAAAAAVVSSASHQQQNFTTSPPTTACSTPAVQTQPPQTAQLSSVEVQWLYICDWRNCPRKKFKSLSDLQHHACTVHAPDHLDPAAEIFCQWGVGPGLCDGIPRKRYSLMTHLMDRHLTHESLRSAVQRRIATGIHNIQPSQPPVTIVRNIEQTQRGNNVSPSLSSSSSSSSLPATTGSSAIHAIKRHTTDFVNSKELMDENEGPVTKSIRLTAALILRNLVTYTATAKRSLRRYEPHLANVALSNVESSGTISHILFELNN